MIWVVDSADVAGSEGFPVYKVSAASGLLLFMHTCPSRLLLPSLSSWIALSRSYE